MDGDVLARAAVYCYGLAEGGGNVAIVIITGMILIVLSADYFTNGVEWLGRSLGLTASAVGTLLAALGTALPETLVPVMAILFGAGHRGDSIGLGAILGAPFMLSTLGFLVLGVGGWWCRRPGLDMTVDARAVRRDLTFFVAALTVALASAFLPPGLRPWLAGGLVGAYLLFARHVILSGRGTATSAPTIPLHLWHEAHPPRWVVVAQVAMALGGLVVGAHFFVQAITGLADASGMNGFLLSVILTPVATELPEVLNSIIWLRRGADTLAFGNVTGAMAFQSSLVPALGMWLTPWHFTPLELVVGVLSLASAAWILMALRLRRPLPGALAAAGLFYFLFVGVAIGGLR